MKPSNFSLPRSATAWNREIVAIEPLSWYVERPGCGALPASRRLICVGGVAAALDGDLGDAGQLVQRHHVADDVHLGVAGQGEVGLHGDPAGAVDLGAGLLAEHPAQRAGLHAGGPDLGGRVDPADLPVGVLDLDAVGVDVGDHRAELDLDADLVELAAGASAELLAERGQHRRARRRAG